MSRYNEEEKSLGDFLSGLYLYETHPHHDKIGHACERLVNEWWRTEPCPGTTKKEQIAHWMAEVIVNVHKHGRHEGVKDAQRRVVDIMAGRA